MTIALGDELWIVFYDLETDNDIPRRGVVTGIRGTQVQLDGGGRWHETAMHPPAFRTEAEALTWIAEHPRHTPTIRGES